MILEGYKFFTRSILVTLRHGLYVFSLLMHKSQAAWWLPNAHRNTFYCFKQVSVLFSTMYGHLP